MLKNKQEREDFLMDNANWTLLYVKSSLCHRLLQLKLTKEFTIIRIDMISNYDKSYKPTGYFIIKNRNIYKPAGIFSNWISLSQLINWLKDVEVDENEKK